MKKIISYLSKYFVWYVLGTVVIALGTNYALTGSARKISLDNLYKEAFCKDCGAKLSDYGPAPEFSGITNWINSEPLTLEKLKGKVVLIDFWTYSCINCIRTLPYVTKWYETYKDQGFVVVGIHTPEFAFEKVSENVRLATERYHITYPVAQDNDYATWQAYHNQYWPAEYLIDKNGHIVYTHFGEGEYDLTENTIRGLLGMPASETSVGDPSIEAKTPEIYFGLSRLEYLSANQEALPIPFVYHFPYTTGTNHFALEGKWLFTQEAAELQSMGALRLNFNARSAYFVAEADQPVTAEIFLDGKKINQVTIEKSSLYTLYQGDQAGKHTLELRFAKPGLKAFTFTFG